jgi:hypothetical protein
MPQDLPAMLPGEEDNPFAPPERRNEKRSQLTERLAYQRALSKPGGAAAGFNSGAARDRLGDETPSTGLATRPAGPARTNPGPSLSSLHRATGLIVDHCRATYESRRRRFLRDASLKRDGAAKAWLQSEAIATISRSKVKLVYR